MGRTPRINKNGGRDHWGNLGPLLRLRRRAEDGAGDRPLHPRRRRARPRPIRIRNLISTIMHTLFDVGQVRLMRGLAGDVAHHHRRRANCGTDAVKFTTFWTRLELVMHSRQMIAVVFPGYIHDRVLR